MLLERRRSPLSPALLAQVGIGWAALSGLLLIVGWSAIGGLKFPDPDDIMRLVQVRDLIAGQSWFDVSQYRVDSANGGVPMHWSRLVDIPLVLVIMALSPFVGMANAELAAIIIVPLFTLAIAMLLAARIAWRLLGEDEAIMTCVAIAVSVPLLFQFGLLRIDHHGWQIVCALTAMNGLMARKASTGGWVAGSAVAFWLTISIEGLPLAAAVFGVLALRWIRNRNERDWLVRGMQALAAVSAVLFLLTRGVGDLATYCDAIGPAQIGMFCWGALVFGVMSKAEPLPLPAIWLGFVVAAGGAIGLMLMAAPQCAGGGFAALDPMVKYYWYDRVHEGLPIWQQLQLEAALHYAVAPLIGIFAVLNLISESRDWLRRFWIDYAIVLIAAFAVSLLVARAGAVAGALAAVPLAWQIRKWLRAIRLMRAPTPRVIATAGVALALLPALPVMLFGWAMPAQASLGGVAALEAKAPKASKCQIAETSRLLRNLPAGEIFAPLDIAPRLLLETDHSVIATGHHRGQAGMKVVIETSLASADDARIALSARGTNYVAICADLGEPRMYAHIAPQGFVANLIDGEPPEWLEPIELNSNSSLKVWRVSGN
ncbi:MAG: hypothetical protein ABJP48_04475 [Erythrobacter sp.]